MKTLTLHAILLLATTVAGFAKSSPNPPPPPDPPSICDAIAGNLVMNCGFETGNFADWTLFGNTGFTGVDGNPNSGNDAAYFGAIGSTGGIQQTIATGAGQTYTLDYYLYSEGGTPNSFSASWDGSTIAGSALTDAGAFGYTEYSFTVTGTGSDTLAFTFQQNPAYWFFDDVSLVASTPEPDSIVLLFLVVGLCAMVLHKRAARTRTSVS